MHVRALTLALVAAMTLTACGGGGGGDDAPPAQPSNPTPPTTPPPTTPPTTTALEITRLELAQTHVMPEAGLQWTLTNAKESLHAIGGREALAILSLSASDARNIVLEGQSAGVTLGTVAVTAGLPPTEAGGPTYAENRYSAVIPRAWMVPGVRLRVRADNYNVGLYHDPIVGADSPLTLRVLPFYLFGANSTNSVPPAEIATVDTGTAEELFAKWPVATLVAQNHPARYVSWPTLVIGPRNGQAAYVARSTNDEHNGFEIMGATLDVLSGLLQANGEAPGPYQYYAPLIMLDAAGKFRGPGGGLGTVGGDTGVGDHDYAGIFVHEQGHAFGLPHAGEAYAQARYPYVGGSLSGSAWGYDAIRREFLAPFVPSTASRYAACKTNTFDGTPRQIDSAGRCIKQDPMQSGAGDEARGYRFATFSDFNAAVMQRHLEGVATNEANGNLRYDGGSIIADATFANGYKRWNSQRRAWDNVAPVTLDNGLYGMDSGLPYRPNVPVHSIVITYSRAGTAGATQIYPPMSYVGNLVRTVDPTNSGERSAIIPNTGPHPWYCHNGGCDYTVRVTYADGSTHHAILQRGFRPWFQPTGTPEATTSDPVNGASFRTWVINVPGDRAVQRIDLLDTPRAWEGIAISPVVLASRTVGAGGPTAASLAKVRLDVAPQCSGLTTVVVPRPASVAPCE